jgi:hypothetical protein
MMTKIEHQHRIDAMSKTELLAHLVEELEEVLRFLKLERYRDGVASASEFQGEPVSDEELAKLVAGIRQTEEAQR